MSEDLKEDLHYYIHHYKVVSFAILAVVFYFLSFVIGFFLFRSNSDSIIRLSFAHYRHTTHFFSPSCGVIYISVPSEISGIVISQDIPPTPKITPIIREATQNWLITSRMPTHTN